jgi:hypothetical protein
MTPASRAHGEGEWAPRVDRLARPAAPDDALNLNVTGRRVSGPVQGFGRLWRKTYRVALSGVDPGAVVSTWRRDFGEFWPPGSRFYAPLTGLAPGEVALLNLTMPGGMPLSTGVLVLYADDESFTLMTPEGHQFAGWITFSGFADGDSTVAQAEVLMRASDPLYEIGMTFGGHRMEDKFWAATLTSLALRFGASDAAIETRVELVDRRRQWKRVGNVRYNAMVRSAAHRAASLARAARMRARNARR